MKKFISILVLLSLALGNTDFNFPRWVAEEGPFSQAKYYDEPQKLPMPKLKKSDAKLTPVVIIPSLIGNQLWASLKGAHEDHWWCYRTSSDYLVWIEEQQLYPAIIDCWAHNMQLFYNNKSYSTPQGVTITAPGFGDVTTVAFLDSKSQIGVWDAVIGNLTAVGYTPGLNIRAATYDWRLGPTAYDLTAIQNLIEDTFEKNNGMPVALTSLSMGGNVARLFLSTMSQAWKDKYIASFTSFSGAFGGSIQAPMSLIGLNNLGTTLNPEIFKKMVQSYGSVVWLSPFQQVFKDNIMVETPTKNYTAADLLQLYIDANATVSAEIYKDLGSYWGLEAPGVPTNCIIGYATPTLYSVAYNVTGNFDTPSGYKVVDGDGTVTTEGLEICSSWAGQQEYPVETYRYAGVNHGATVHYLPAIEVLMKILGV